MREENSAGGLWGKGCSLTKKDTQEEMTYLLGSDVIMSRSDPWDCSSHFTSSRGTNPTCERVDWKDAENLKEPVSNHRTYQLWQSLYPGHLVV